MLTDKRIGVLAGGASAEREVSLKSGNTIYKALLSRGYNAVFIDASDNLCDDLKREKIEIAFIALHGGYGENGAIQGLLEVMGIPYTGSGVLASALAMDKEASKKIFLYHNIPVTPFVVIEKDNLKSQISNLKSQFVMPWVVKPVSEGSSIGVNIAKSETELDSAIEDAFNYGKKIIIEKYIKGKEIQIGILGQRALGGVEVRPTKEFYSYEAKYTQGLTEYILPPQVNDSEYEMLQSTALRAHNALGCSGATRVDLILDSFGKAYVLEVNTIPGMTETSLLPKIARLAGMGFPDLIEAILKLALKTAPVSDNLSS
ncbi:MAG: D-alanine--D-alanine ligase [Thermodesulfovibrionales bacterium]|nr:D-alanine--D-alanine ligase [Thermodesulfovibrionales bacterium]